MRYFAQYNEYDELIAIGTGYDGVEITKSTYNAFFAEICTKPTLVDQLYNREITISDIPTEWQEEIQRRVDERIELEGTLEEQPISSDEFYSMVEEVL